MIVILTLLLCAPAPLRAQSSLDLRINELLIVNDSNYVDDYGQRGPWIEVFNSAYNTVNVGGLYLTNDLSDPTKYRIPKGQPVTAIAQRGFIVFIANDNPTNGILHVNFDLRSSSIIALYDRDGKTLIDSVSLPRKHRSDISWGRSLDGSGVWGWFEKTTPGSSNQTEQTMTAADRFGAVDQSGSGLTIISMGVVFSALILLSIVFTMIGKLMSGGFFKKKAEAADEASAKVNGNELSGEVAAAIMMSLELYRRSQSEDESAVLTINRMSKMYSPWSSKIYGMRATPDVRRTRR